MQKVDKNGLAGFRRPTEAESRRIGGSVSRRMQRTMHVFWFWSIFLIILDLAVLPAAAGILKAYDFRQRMVFGVMGLGISVLLLWLFAQIKEKKVLADRMIRGEFEILDCKIYEIHAEMDVPHGTAVRICSMSGQLCEEYFRLENIYVDNWKKNRDSMFQLIRCRSEKSEKRDFYELFSEEKQKRG